MRAIELEILGLIEQTKPLIAMKNKNSMPKLFWVCIIIFRYKISTYSLIGATSTDLCDIISFKPSWMFEQSCSNVGTFGAVAAILSSVWWVKKPRIHVFGFVSHQIYQMSVNHSCHLGQLKQYWDFTKNLTGELPVWPNWTRGIFAFTADARDILKHNVQCVVTEILALSQVNSILFRLHSLCDPIHACREAFTSKGAARL